MAKREIGQENALGAEKWNEASRGRQLKLCTPCSLEIDKSPNQLSLENPISRKPPCYLQRENPSGVKPRNSQ